MREFGKWALAGVSLVAFATAGHAAEVATVASVQAQPDDSDSSDIIVSARRRDESVQDVPLVVNAVTSESIAKLNFRKFEDITAIVPGLNVSTSKSSAGSPTTLRGVNFQSGVSGSNNSVGYYFNDAVIQAGAVTFQMFDIAQIEVLRGPQGTLRGRSTPSGSINFRTRGPDLSDFGGTVSASAYDPTGYNLNGAINVPIIKDKLAVRVAGLVTKDRADDVRSLSNAQDPFSKTNSIRASVRADPFDGVLLLDFSYQNQRRKTLTFDQVESASTNPQILAVNAFGASPVTIRATDRRIFAGALPIASDFKSEIYNWQAKLNLLGQSLTYTGLVEHDNYYANDPQDDNGSLANPIAPSGARFELTNYTPNNEFSHEIRLQNQDRIAGIFDYVIGGLFLKIDSDPLIGSPTGLVAGSPLALTGIIVTPLIFHTNSKEQSYFGNITAHLGEKTELSGGLRHITYKAHSDGFLNTATPTQLYSLDFKFSHTIYSASLKHRFNENLMAYASFGTSWRPNGIAVNGPTRPSALQSQFLNTPAETSKSYEIGIRTSMLDKRLTFNLTAFQQDYTNYPYRSPTQILAVDAARNQVRGFNYVAGVPVQVRGIEAEFSARPTESLNLGGVISYSKGTIQNGLIPCFDFNKDGVPDTVTTVPSVAALQAAYGGENITGCRFTGPANTAPDWAATLTAEYTMPISNTIRGFGRGLLNYQGATANDPVNPYDRVSSYALVNLYVGVRDADDAWEFTLYGKNITNTFRVLTTTNGPATTPTASGTFTNNNYFGITSTLPREFGISARFSFGSR